MVKQCFFILIGILFIAGCVKQNQTNINTNALLQTDYDYFCLDGTKTFSQIIECQIAENNAERSQNKITNELILQN